MSQTERSTSPDSGGARRADAPIDQVRASELGEPAGHKQRYRALSLGAAGTICVLALPFLAAGGWALWMDQIDRDSSGFISIGETADLETETYAIVSELRGDGPRWLYGSTILGDARVRATSQNVAPIFIGIARTSDVSRYLDGAGYATIEHLETADLATHPGRALSIPPAQASIWAASTQGTGEQTVIWKPRGRDWSIVLLNADASAHVAIQGNVSAEFPALPWAAAGLLVFGSFLAAFGGWFLTREIRRAEGGPVSGLGSVCPQVSRLM